MEEYINTIERLKNDEDYYGDFGKQFLSNSDIGTLLKKPEDLHKPLKKTTAMLVGGYFHTVVLEPDKINKYKIIQERNRNTKAYKEMSGGELCLLQHEVDQIELLKDKMLENDILKGLIHGTHCDSKIEYEVPNITVLCDLKWKGKVDILNHDEKLIIDIKTTSDIDSFKWSSKKYNYDSQAYIYRNLFDYDFIFIVIDKNTHKLNIFEVSNEAYERGQEKVEKAAEAYKLYYQSKDFDPKQYLEVNTI